MARPKLRLDLTTAEDKENVVAAKDSKKKLVPDVARDLQALQCQVVTVLGNQATNAIPPSHDSSCPKVASQPSESLSASFTIAAANGICTPDLTAPLADFNTCSSSDSVSSASNLIQQPSTDFAADFHVPKVSNNDPKAQICFDFTKGVCTRGGSCKFSHDVALIVSVNSQERGICFDFLRGQCHRGLLCRFSHDLSSLAAQQCQRGNRRNAPICYDFVKGVCARGPDCRYSHDINSIINDTRHSSQHPQTGQLCHDYSKGRCARGTACRYSHDFSALTASPPLMPALTAAAAAAAIAQLSLNPGGLLPHLAPYLQSYIPSVPQPGPLQQQLLFDRRQHTVPAPQPNLFNKMAFAQPAARPIREFVPRQPSPFNMPNLNTIPSFPGPDYGASPRQHDMHHHVHNSLLSQKLQEQRASQHLGFRPRDRFGRSSSPPALAPQRSMPHLYGAPGEHHGHLAGFRAGSSLDSVQSNASFARPFKPAVAPSPSPAYTSILQSMPPSHAASRAADMPLSLSSVSQPTPSHVPDLGHVSSTIKSSALPVASSQKLRIPAAMHPPALRTLALHDQSKDLHGSTAVQSGSLVMGQSEHHSIDALCFNTPAMTVMPPASEESFHRLEGDCKSSTSENSSVHACEASDASLQSAGSGHLFMCQEIWKR